VALSQEQAFIISQKQAIDQFLFIIILQENAFLQASTIIEKPFFYVILLLDN